MEGGNFVPPFMNELGLTTKVEGEVTETVNSDIEKSSPGVITEVELSKLDELRENMLRILDGSNETDLPLNDPYWDARNAFHQEYRKSLEG